MKNEESPMTAVSTEFDPKTPRQLRNAAGIFLCVLFLGLLMAGFQDYGHESALAKDAQKESSEKPIVDVAEVKSAPESGTLTLPGETHGWYESTLYTRVNGYISNWFADIGDHVKKDQVLATIDTPDLDAQLTAAEAKLKSSEAESKVAQARSELAKATYQRVWDAPKGVVSDEERDQSKAEYDSSLSNLAASLSQVNLSRADVENLRALTAFKEVKAPFSGTVTERRIDIGDLVTAGSTTNTTSLYELAQTDKIRVFMEVPESASIQMKNGLPVDITAEEYPGKTFKGTISRSSEMINSSSKTLKVEVDIPNSDGKLMPGMYVRASFELSHGGLLEIPASAILYTASGPEAAVVDALGKVHFKAVKIASDEGEFIEIGGGLAKGDRVALNISDEIADGQSVTANQTE